MCAIAAEQMWYVKKGRRVQGPFKSEEIERFMILGRVRNTDKVSTDGELWEPVTQVPQLVPTELLDMETGLADYVPTPQKKFMIFDNDKCIGKFSPSVIRFMIETGTMPGKVRVFDGQYYRPLNEVAELQPKLLEVKADSLFKPADSKKLRRMEISVWLAISFVSGWIVGILLS